MKERPILFSAPMVLALLDGTKTQTRRIIKKQPTENPSGLLGEPDRIQLLGPNGYAAKCPYGTYFDRLWVRETYFYNQFDAPFSPEEVQRDDLYYRADYAHTLKGKPDFEGEEAEMRWSTPIFMPRWASRITLEIVNIRAERLQDITEADAQAEGAEPGTEMWPEDPAQYGTYRLGFRHLWESINGKGSWDENPWAWAVSFKPVTP